MDDPDLAAIRAARMQQLRTQGGASGSPSGNGAPAGMPSMGGQPGGAGGGGGGADEARQQQAAEEQKRQILSSILDNGARERLSRIALVKPQKARAIQDLILRMAQSGQVRQRISEDQLIGLLEQVEGQQGDESRGKITFTRKQQVLEDSDDDFDL